MNATLQSMGAWAQRRVRGAVFAAWFTRIAWRSAHAQWYVFRGVPSWVVRRFLNCGTEVWENAAADELAVRMIREHRARQVPRVTVTSNNNSAQPQP